MMRRLVTTVLTLLLVFALAGCGTGSTPEPAGTGSGAPTPDTGASDQTRPSTLEKAKAQGYVTVGFANEAPYAYATPEGKLTGEAVEVARAVLAEMGITEMVGVLTEFGSLIPGLKAGRFDMVTAGMFIKPERCQQVLFANPEYSVGEALGVQAGNPLNLHSYEDVKNHPEAKIAVMAGGVEHTYVQKVGVPDDRIVVVPDQPSALAALQAGRAHAITMTGPALQSLLETSKATDVERVMDFTQPIIDGKTVSGYGATAFRQEDTDFAAAFNQGLERLKQSGKLLEILEQFGFTSAELPGDAQAAELCQG